MAWFPPSIVNPNTVAFLSDQKMMDDGFPERFPSYEADAIVYWPWLSWDPIDVVVGAEQQAIPRCLLLGEQLLFGLVPNLVGSIVQFGAAANPQLWEVIHFFYWFDPNDQIKKFALCWLRLYDAPPPPIPVTGGATAAEAVSLSYGQNYLIELAALEPQWFQTGAPSPDTQLSFQAIESSGNVEQNEYYSGEPIGMPTHTTSWPTVGFVAHTWGAPGLIQLIPLDGIGAAGVLKLRKAP
jgi:hypothetical protein